MCPACHVVSPRKSVKSARPNRPKAEVTAKPPAAMPTKSDCTGSTVGLFVNEGERRLAEVWEVRKADYRPWLVERHQIAVIRRPPEATRRRPARTVC